MANYYYQSIFSGDLFLEIPLAVKNQAPAHPLKVYLSLKPAGDMAFFKRDLLPSREGLFSQLQIDPSRVYSLYQEHTRHVVKVEKKKKPENYHSVTGDGMITMDKGIFLSVTVADCLPIFFLDKQTGAFGIVHSGWKGTGIILKAVKCMEKEYRVRKENLRVIIGPGIGPCCYAVPEKRYHYFSSHFGKECCRKDGEEFFIDLKKANLKLLEKTGITDIDIFENCTSCDRSFHSFRRDGKDHFGVMMALAGYFQ
jgi:polyphenol oxidase